MPGSSPKHPLHPSQACSLLPPARSPPPPWSQPRLLQRTPHKPRLLRLCSWAASQMNPSAARPLQRHWGPPYPPQSLREAAGLPPQPGGGPQKPRGGRSGHRGASCTAPLLSGGGFMLPLSLRGSLQGPWTSPHPRQACPGVRLQLRLSRVQTLSAPPGLRSTCCTPQSLPASRRRAK